MPSALELLWLAKLVLGAMWAVRIWRLGLIRRYPVLFAYLIFVTIIVDVAGSWLYNSHLRLGSQKAYNVFWVFVQPVCWLLWFGVVYEVYDHMVERYAGVRKLGRMVLYGSLGGLAVVLGVLLHMNLYRIPDLNQWKSFWLKQEQGVYMGIALLVFVLLAFRRVFRLSVSRNVQLIFTTFGLYFAGFAALMVIRTYMGPEFRPIRDMVSMVLYIACLACGGFLFSRSGETQNVGPLLEGQVNPEMAARAAQQLQSFNDRLVRVLNA